MAASCSMCCASWRPNRLSLADNGKGGLRGPPFLLVLLAQDQCWRADQPASGFLRRRAIIAATAPPNKASIGGAGTLVPPVEVLLVDPPLVLPPLVVDVDPPLVVLPPLVVVLDPPLDPPVDPDVLVELDVLPPVDPDVLLDVLVDVELLVDVDVLLAPPLVEDAPFTTTTVPPQPP